MISQLTRVLICDDDDDVRSTLEWFLTQGEFEVLTAASGPAALDLLSRERVDVVLLDLLMPGMTGNDVLLRLKMNPVTSAIPVVILTSMDDMHTMSQCLRMGACDYAVKPLDIVSLRRVLEKAIRPRPSQGPERPPLAPRPVPDFSSMPAPRTHPVSTSSLDDGEVERLHAGLEVFVRKVRAALAEVHAEVVAAIELHPDVPRLHQTGMKLSEIDLLLHELLALDARSGTG